MTTSSPYGQPANLDPYATAYGQPYGPYAVSKSKTTAALLAVFLGTFGAHNFYRGQLGRGFGHVALIVAAVVCTTVASVMDPDTVMNSANLSQTICWLLCSADWIWVIIEFIMILVSEDGSLQ